MPTDDSYLVTTPLHQQLRDAAAQGLNPFDQFDNTGVLRVPEPSPPEVLAYARQFSPRPPPPPDLPPAHHPVNPFDAFDDSGALKESPVVSQGYGMSEGAALSGPLWDAYFTNTPIRHVLSAFGQGVRDQWGAGTDELSPEAQKALQRSGQLENYLEGRSSLIRAFNEAMIRPAAIAGGFVGAVGASAAQLASGIAGSMQPKAYLESEEKLLSGQMTEREAAGFFAMHVLGGAVPEMVRPGGAPQAIAEGSGGGLLGGSGAGEMAPLSAGAGAVGGVTGWRVV